MAVLQMQRISICGLKKDRKAILEKIQTLGVMEMSQIAEDEEGFEKMDTVNARQTFEKRAQAADQALAVLDAYVPVKKSLLSSLEGKKLVSSGEIARAADEKAGDHPEGKSAYYEEQRDCRSKSEYPEDRESDRSSDSLAYAGCADEL